MLASLIATALLTQATKAAPVVTNTAQSERTKITIGDEVVVTVVGFQDYSAKYVVVDDGFINVVPVGEVRAAGRTLNELQKELTKSMARYVANPVVIVTYASKANSDIFVVGVEGVGRAPYREDMDIRTLLAGAKASAGSPDTYTVRVFRKNKKIAEFNLQDALIGDLDKYWNGPLMPQDVITVLSTEDQRVYFTGDFQRSGELFFKSGTTLSQALSKAGAIGLPVPPEGRVNVYEDRARIVVRRGTEESKFKLHGDKSADTFTLQNGDVVALDLPRRVSVTVNGFVKNPHPVVLLAGDDVRSAVAAVGGATDDGSVANVLVWHNNEAHSYDLRTSSTQPPVPVDDGDVVYVQRNDRSFRVFGEVKNPGPYPFLDDQRIFAADVIARAGGLGQDGTLRRMIIMRADETGKFKPIEFNLDEFVKDGKKSANPEVFPGDIVYISKTRGGFGLAQLTTLVSGLLLIDTIKRNN